MLTDSPPGPLAASPVRALDAPRLARGLWRLADPKVSLASIASMALGALAAAADGPISAGWLALTVLGILAIETGKNAAGEIVDFDSGVDLAVAPQDRSPFSGGKRVLVDRLLTRRQTRTLARIGFGVGILAGLWIALAREPRVLALGVAGVACAYAYHAPPFRLSYRGLGELAVALCYGPLVACGTYLVQRGAVSRGILLVSVPLGLLVAAFLWINEFPDWAADTKGGKRTLVVRLGRAAASRVYAGIVVGAFLGIVALPWLGAPEGVRLGLIGFPAAAHSARTLLDRPEETAAIVPAQRTSLLAFLLLAIGSGTGFLVGS